MTIDEITNIIEDAVEHFGMENTAHKFIEEMGECTQMVCKIMEGSTDYDHMAEEMADVLITWEKWLYAMCMADEYFFETYRAWKAEKLERLERLINDSKGIS